jgi:divalent metal cation (Fe/Co/Zn/Cd) transporter
VPVDVFWVNVAVLVAAFLFESYAFRKAYAELTHQTERYGWSGLREAFHKTSDVTTLTAFTEDAVALSGVGIALVGITARRLTGNEVYDAVAAMLIGALLMTFAVALAWENKRLLVGESLPVEVEETLRGEISDHEGVIEIDGFRTMFIGPGQALVTADVSFDPGMDTEEIDDRITSIEEDIMSSDPSIKRVYIEPEV